MEENVKKFPTEDAEIPKYMNIEMDDDWLNDNVDKSESFDMFDETGSVSTNNEEDFSFD